MAREANRAPAERPATPQIRLYPWTLLWSPGLLAVLLVVVALVPRTLGLHDYLTTDEAYHWIERVSRFSAALASGDLRATSQTGHPGVTLMWLGSLGLALERAARAQGWTTPTTIVEHLAWLRLPHAVLEAILVGLGYLLLRRLVKPSVALLAGVLWAISPYLIAHARLLHLDALLTSFVTLSLLALLAAIFNRPATIDRGLAPTGSPAALISSGRQLGWLVLSGVFAGLALLTKGPALILLAFAAVVFAIALVAGVLDEWRKRSAIRKLLARVIPPLLWLGVALLVVAALWPALWVDAPGVLGNYVDEIRSNGGRPNGDGQFFLGQAVGDPGLLFYPVANLFRMTPATLLGLALCCGFWIRVLGFRRHGSIRAICSQHQALIGLLAFILFWTLVMTIGPKKFDRYVLPTWPSLLVLAAAGLVWALDSGSRLVGQWRRSINTRSAQSRIARGLFGIICVIELSQPLLFHPYYLSYYNPLLGGGAVAQRVLLIGWGEGMDRVGAYLSNRPDIGYGPVLSALGPTLAPFVPAPVRDVDELHDGPHNYAVVYLESIQRGANRQIYAKIRQTTPLHTITIHGIDYAEIYQLPRPFATPVGATFGGALHLRGVTVERVPGQLLITPSWDVRARPTGDFALFLHLLDEQGRRVAQVDVAPGGGEDPSTNAWEPGRQIAVPIGLGLPPGLPAGMYQLVLGLYDPHNGARLPPSGGVPANAAQAGPEALLVDTLRLP